MRLWSLFKLELAKQKRGLIWTVVFIIPLGTTLGMYLYMTFRDYDKFLQMVGNNGLGLWQALLLENHFNLGWGRFMPLMVALLSTLIYYREYKEDSWKNLLSQPLSKNRILLAKLLAAIFFTGLMLALNTAGLILVGKIIGFAEPIDILLYSKYIFYQLAALTGVISIQNWLSSYFKNMLLPLAFSLGGMIVSGMLFNLYPESGRYLPYFYHYLIGGFSTAGYQGLSPYTGLSEGIISGILIYLFSYLEFKRRDIN